MIEIFLAALILMGFIVVGPWIVIFVLKFLDWYIDFICDVVNL